MSEQLAKRCEDCVGTRSTLDKHAFAKLADFIPSNLSLAVMRRQKKDPTFDFSDELEASAAKNLANNLKVLVRKGTSDNTLEADVEHCVEEAGYGLEEMSDMLGANLVNQTLKVGHGDIASGLASVACAACQYTTIFK